MDTSDERLQDGNVVIFFDQYELEEGTDEGGLTDASQEEVEVCGGRDHLLKGRLKKPSQTQIRKHNG